MAELSLSKLEYIKKALEDYAECVMHDDDDCPLDDTCECYNIERLNTAGLYIDEAIHSIKNKAQ